MQMLFSEIYGAYYNAVAKILSHAVNGTLNERTVKEVVSEKAFGESALTIPYALKSGRWQLLRPDMTTPIQRAPTMPLTEIEKRWLKAIMLDPKIRLFDISLPYLEDVVPLFTPKDISYYDRYCDGDDYSSPEYITRFKLILSAIKEKRPLKIVMQSRTGVSRIIRAYPLYLEYSEKDDKFRLIAASEKNSWIVNLGRIVYVKNTEASDFPFPTEIRHRTENVTFELTDDRNALERVMLHFSHLKNTVKRTGEVTYEVTLEYDREDDTEILIRLLSFGPMIRVLSPEKMKNQIKERLTRQKNCGLG